MNINLFTFCHTHGRLISRRMRRADTRSLAHRPDRQCGLRPRGGLRGASVCPAINAVDRTAPQCAAPYRRGEKFCNFSLHAARHCLALFGTVWHCSALFHTVWHSLALLALCGSVRCFLHGAAGALLRGDSAAPRVRAVKSFLKYGNY